MSAMTGKVVLSGKIPDRSLMAGIEDPVSHQTYAGDIGFPCKPADRRSNIQRFFICVTDNKKDIDMLCSAPAEMFDPGFHIQDNNLVPLDHKMAQQGLHYRMGRACAPPSHGFYRAHDKEIHSSRCRDCMPADDIIDRECEPKYTGVAGAGLQLDKVLVLRDRENTGGLAGRQAKGKCEVGGCIGINCDDPCVRSRQRTLQDHRR